MPRTAKRISTAPQNSPSVKSSYGRSGKAKTKEMGKIDNMFDKYASQGVIDPDGIMTLCKDLKLEHTDVRILMLAWNLKATKLGYFTLDEWRTGMKTLKVNTLTELKNAVSELEKKVNTPPNYEDFYLFAFRYHLTEKKQKNIDIESVCELLKLVLGSHFRRQVDLLVDYLKVQSNYKVINLDQWVNFYRFCNEITFPDLQNYDETKVWPLILDNFVELLREKHR